MDSIFDNNSVLDPERQRRQIDEALNKQGPGGEETGPPGPQGEPGQPTVPPFQTIQVDTSPTTMSNLPDGQWAVIKSTTDGGIFVVANDEIGRAHV